MLVKNVTVIGVVHTARASCTHLYRPTKATKNYRSKCTNSGGIYCTEL